MHALQLADANVCVILPCCLENGETGVWNVPKFSPKMEIVFEMEGLNPSTNYALATHENGYQQSKNFHTTIGWSIQHI